MVKNYLSLVKFSHTIFALPFALIGFFLAINSNDNQFSLMLFVLVILCMVFARNAAMGFNRLIDRHIDSRNPRTAVREIPKGIISEKSALYFVIINSILFIISTFFINKLVFFLSPVALFVILGYSYTKKFTFLCHFVLGLGLSLAPIGAYISITGKFETLPLIISCIVFFWVTGFDIIYALQDISFDKEENLKSIPAYIGKLNAIYLSTVLHLIVIVLILVTVLMYDFNYLYRIGSFIFIALLIYQHILVKPNDLSKINLAFFTTNGIASTIYAAFTISSLYL